MVSVLFWDIDGTLLSTGRAGIFAWEDATFDVTGRQIDFTSLATAGLTDMEIADRILSKYTEKYTEYDRNKMVALYEGYLPDALPRKQGSVLPGVIELLDTIKDRTDIVLALLTGNTEKGAEAKLSYYGLNSYFSFGSFSGERADRDDIALHALSLAHQQIPDIQEQSVYVIGDTPYDIRCGKAIRARTIAVATGVYNVSELRAHEPD
jgi:phosphoglycolate phosphatase-like HAD superfamily hydrolase